MGSIPVGGATGAMFINIALVFYKIKGVVNMKVSKVYNGTLLSIIAQKEEITYEELKAEYCEPTPKGVVSGRNEIKDRMTASAIRPNQSRSYHRRLLFTENISQCRERQRRNPLMICSSASCSVSPSVISFVSCSPAIFPIAASWISDAST